MDKAEAKSAEECKKIVAAKYRLGTTLVTGHKSSYWEEAMEHYASQAVERYKKKVMMAIIKEAPDLGPDLSDRVHTAYENGLDFAYNKTLELLDTAGTNEKIKH